MRGTPAGDRLVILVFSEFGRRVADNASQGTDHGTLGLHFLLGSAVRGGLYGRPCSLSELDEGDLIQRPISAASTPRPRDLARRRPGGCPRRVLSDAPCARMKRRDDHSDGCALAFVATAPQQPQRAQRTVTETFTRR